MSRLLALGVFFALFMLIASANENHSIDIFSNTSNESTETAIVTSANEQIAANLKSNNSITTIVAEITQNSTIDQQADFAIPDNNGTSTTSVTDDALTSSEIVEASANIEEQSQSTEESGKRKAVTAGFGVYLEIVG